MEGSKQDSKQQARQQAASKTESNKQDRKQQERIISVSAVKHAQNGGKDEEIQ